MGRMPARSPESPARSPFWEARARPGPKNGESPKARTLKLKARFRPEPKNWVGPDASDQKNAKINMYSEIIIAS